VSEQDWRRRAHDAGQIVGGPHHGELRPPLKIIVAMQDPLTKQFYCIGGHALVMHTGEPRATWIDARQNPELTPRKGQTNTRTWWYSLVEMDRPDFGNIPDQGAIGARRELTEGAQSGTERRGELR
jgi:hypothetical protein